MNQHEIEPLPVLTPDQFIEHWIRNAIWRHTGKFPYKPAHWVRRYLVREQTGCINTLYWKGKPVLQITEHFDFDGGADNFYVQCRKRFHAEYLGEKHPDYLKFESNK